MPTEPSGRGSSGSSLWSIARNLIDGQATTRDNIERTHDVNQRTFIASTDTELGSDESLNFRLENPTSSDRSCHFYYGELVHEDDIRVELHTSTSNLTGVEPLSTENNYIGSSVASVVTVETVGSFDSVSSHFTQIYIGGGTHQVFDGYRITVPPGESILLEMDNLGGNNALGARFGWAESEELVSE